MKNFLGLQSLCLWARELGASALHLQAGQAPLLSIEGRLESVGAPPLPPGLIDELMPLAGKRLFVEEVSDFRIQVTQLPTGANVTLRPILAAPSWQELGLPPELSEAVLERQGIVIVCGNPASRARQTWAALLDSLNVGIHGHLIVLEQAREFAHFHKNSMVSQRELGEDFQDWTLAIQQASCTTCEVLALDDVSALTTLDAALQAAHIDLWLVLLVQGNSCQQALAQLIERFPERRRGHIRERLGNYLAWVICHFEEELDGLHPTAQMREALVEGRMASVAATHTWPPG